MVVFKFEDVREGDGYIEWYNAPIELAHREQVWKTMPFPLSPLNDPSSSSGLQLENGAHGASSTKPGGTETATATATDQDKTMEDDPSSSDLLEWETYIQNADRFHSDRTTRFEFLFGDETAAVYLRVPKDEDDASDHEELRNRKYEIDYGILQSCIPILDSGKLQNYLRDCCTRTESQQCLAGLQIMAAAAQVYKLLPQSTVTLRALEQTVSKEWSVCSRSPPSEEYGIFLPIPIRRADAFALVVFLETGVHQLDANKLENVMAVCSGDSIYAAVPLLCDPGEQPAPYELRRVFGNVGRAGISLLIPPANPRLKKVGIESWNVIAHLPFDGVAQDSFDKTSLHLWHTGYHEAVAEIRHQGAQDIEIFFLESVISVYNSGDFVGDLDILKMLDDLQLHRLTPCDDCNHGAMRLDEYSKLKTIDSWMELLQPANGLLVVRAHGNWLGRLAATAISLSLGMRTFVLPEDAAQRCWRGFIERVKSIKPRESIVLIS